MKREKSKLQRKDVNTVFKSRKWSPTRPTQRCKVCLRIFRVLRSPIRDTCSETLGTVNEVILSASCHFHKKLITETLKIDFSINPDDELRVYALPDTPGVSISSWHSSESSELQLLKPSGVLSRAGRGRKLHPQWIDRGQLKRWKDACEQSHGQECAIFPGAIRFLSPGPSLLIDTWRCCLVQREHGIQYVALSYVWGCKKSFMTYRNNLMQLQEPGALSIEVVIENINTTVRTAMQVVELLGERYLWADQLCIVQDDEISKAAEIQNMAAIYAHASLTVIAASNADCGISGIPGVSKPRHLRQVIHEFRREEISEMIWRSRTPVSISTPSSWYQRGWTFQEQLFSCRRLVFSGDTVQWECKRAIWMEDHRIVHDEEAIHCDTNKHAMMFSHTIPDIGGLVYLLSDYSQRDFTFQEDAMFACAGMFSALRPMYSRGFISGLPQGFFDSALLWLHYGTATRRKAEKQMIGKICLPSWSWVGWKGQLDCWSWHGEQDFLKRSPHSMFKHDCRHLFRPRVQWYSQMSLESEPEPIYSNWKDYRRKYTDSDEASPPSGWTRLETNLAEHTSTSNDSNPPTQSKAIPRWIYKHESAPGSEFWYPIPFPESTKNMETNIPAPLISCRTRRSYAIGGEYIVDYRPTISLLDRNSNWIGALNLHEELLPDEYAWNTYLQAKKSFELVEVGEGCYPENIPRCPNLDELGVQDRPKTGELYEFYFVLWIQWNCGVAYRKGLGRVIKDAWEAQHPEEIVLILG